MNGKNVHPLFKYVKSKKGSRLLGSRSKWNFTKFLVDRDGNVINRFAPTVSSLDIKSDIEKLL